MPDEVVKVWAHALVLKVDTVISLLWRKPNGSSEFKFYKSVNSDAEFAPWLASFFPADVLIIERHTIDSRPVPSVVHAVIAQELPKLIDQGRSVAIVDSGGVQRTGAVAKTLGAKVVT